MLSNNKLLVRYSYAQEASKILGCEKEFNDEIKKYDRLDLNPFKLGELLIDKADINLPEEENIKAIKSFLNQFENSYFIWIYGGYLKAVIDNNGGFGSGEAWGKYADLKDELNEALQEDRWDKTKLLSQISSDAMDVFEYGRMPDNVNIFILSA